MARDGAVYRTSKKKLKQGKNPASTAAKGDKNWQNYV